MTIEFNQRGNRMKKRHIAILIVVILLLGLFACGKADVASPAASPSNDSNDSNDVLPLPDTTASAIDSANTAEELRALIQTYQDSGDHESTYLAAKKLIALEPADSQAYQAAIAALLGSISSDYDEIQELLLLGLQNAPEGAERLSQWANEQNQTFSYTIPFFADYTSESEINLVGTTAGNLTNLEVSSTDQWLYGLMTTQGNWIYFSQPGDDYSIYKMRVDGTGIKKIADARGDSINVVGDWLYYLNLSDERKPYRIRTDGTGKEGPLSNSASVMAVSDDSIYSLDHGIYITKQNTDETVLLVDGDNTSMGVYDGWIYYGAGSSNDNDVFCRISTNGGDPQKLLDGWMFHYDMSDGWIYYYTNQTGDSVWRMRPDGSEQTELYRSENTLRNFAVIKNQLVVSVCTDVDDRGKPVPTELHLIDVATGAVQQTRKASTGSIYVVADSIFYLENGVWQMWDLSTGEAGIISYSDATKETGIITRADVSLTTLGFKLDPILGIYSYSNDETKSYVSIARPDLGESQADCNLELLQKINGYLIGIWYYEKDNQLTIQADKGEISAYFYYDLTNKTYGNESSNTGSVQEQFETALGKQEGDFHDAALQLFTDTIQELFGISWQELYALPLI